jgi:N-acetylmuramoyl-L-alanine amidase
LKAILDHPENAEFKKSRENPNILVAGDRIFIPDPEPKDESASTQQRTVFQLAGLGLELHAKIVDQGFVAFSGDVELKALGTTTAMKPNGEVFEGFLDPTAKQATLQFPVSKTERKRLPITLEPGRLDPIETLSGLQQRLNNLGYFAGFVKTPATDPKKLEQQDLQLFMAVQEFQCDHMKPPGDVDGVPGKNTLDKVKEVYGV